MIVALSHTLFAKEAQSLTGGNRSRAGLYMARSSRTVRGVRVWVEFISRDNNVAAARVSMQVANFLLGP